MNLGPVQSILTPARRWAAGFFVLSGGCVAVWMETNAADAWMPNAATGLVGLALTITLVEWIVRTSDRERARPRISGALRSLVIDMHMTADWTHPDERSAHYVASVDDEVERFVAGIETETREPLLSGRRDDLMRSVDAALEQMRELRDRDSDVLDHPVVLAIDEYLQGLDLVQAAYAQSLRKETPDRRTEVRRMAYKILGQRVSGFSKAVGPYVPEARSLSAEQVARMNAILRERPYRYRSDPMSDEEVPE